ncbi:MAG TPA: gamma carbonic anhydrase family protein [Stellaceae bacterium]|nr:gamma carbonic anhydrase family protein [Stellaceae bacterium]
MTGLILPFRGRLPEIAADAWVAPNATVIGDVVIGAGSSIWFGVVLRGDGEPIHVGARTNIQDGTVVHVSGGRFPTWIGDDVSIGHMALIHGCTLEDGAFVGMTACVMDGVVVEGGALVAAGALVTPGKRVPAGELWAGRPARFLRKLTPEDRTMAERTASGYRALGAEYREEGS